MEMKRALFFVVLVVFAATAAVTLLGITAIVPVPDAYLTPLVTALLLEVAAVCIALFRKTEFFGSADAAAASIEKILGGWWQLAYNHGEIAITFVDIRARSGDGMPNIYGSSHAAGGESFARWTSAVTLFRAATNELVYLWEGEEYGNIEDGLIGVGAFVFEESFEKGRGWFTESAAVEATTTRRVKVDIRRASESDTKVMRGADEDAKRALVADVDQRWRARLPRSEPRPRQIHAADGASKAWLELLGVAEVYPTERAAEPAIIAAIERSTRSVDVVGINHRSCFQNDSLREFWRGFDAKRGRKLRVFLLDPRGVGIDAVAQREGAAPTDVAMKVELTLRELRQTFANDGRTPEFLEIRTFDRAPEWRLWAFDVEREGDGGTIFAKGYVPGMPGAELPMMRLVHSGPQSALFRLLQGTLAALRVGSTQV